MINCGSYKTLDLDGGRFPFLTSFVMVNCFLKLIFNLTLQMYTKFQFNSKRSGQHGGGWTTQLVSSQCPVNACDYPPTSLKKKSFERIWYDIITSNHCSYFLFYSTIDSKVVYLVFGVTSREIYGFKQCSNKSENCQKAPHEPAHWRKR